MAYFDKIKGRTISGIYINTEEDFLSLPIDKARIYNYDSDEAYENAMVILGKPNGIINVNQSPHQFGYQIFLNGQDRDWRSSQVDISSDGAKYELLSPEKRRMFDLVLAQLITNDSVQTQQLAIGIMEFITSPTVNLALARQCYEEALHAESYTRMAEDVCKNTKYIYNLYKEDEYLFRKNKSVADMYSKLYENKDSKNRTTVLDVIMAMVANQILEELVFPGGFVAMYSLENELTGCAEMIREIHKDESLTHVPLFKNIFNTCMRELFGPNRIPHVVVNKALDAIKHMCEEEIVWTNYITKNVLGFSERSIRWFVESQANSVCKNLKLPLIYEEVDDKDNPLRTILKDRLLAPSRGTIFDKPGTDYTSSFDKDF